MKYLSVLLLVFSFSTFAFSYERESILVREKCGDVEALDNLGHRMSHLHVCLAYNHKNTSDKYIIVEGPLRTSTITVAPVTATNPNIEGYKLLAGSGVLVNHGGSHIYKVAWVTLLLKKDKAILEINNGYLETSKEFDFK